MRMVSSRLAPWKPGAITSINSGVASTPTSTIADVVSARMRAHRARHASRFFFVALGQQARIDRNERRRKHALAEQVLQEIGDAERGVEGVGRRPTSARNNRRRRAAAPAPRGG